MVNQFTKDKAFDDALSILSQRSVYFGHQSVGYNIMDGITDIHNGSLTMYDLEKAVPDSFPSAYFAHNKIGKNFHPDTKIKSFEENTKTLFAKPPQIAVMKFCFVDIERDTDVEKLFTEYRVMTERFHREFPTVALVHVTAPLTPVGGIKGQIKNIIKFVLGKEDSNIKRMQFNTELRNTYSHDNLFDLAALESTYANGKKNCRSKKGFTYDIMLDEYNLDSGHLNVIGRQYVAGEFIKFLAHITLQENVTQ